MGHRRPRRTTWTSTASTRRSTSRRRSPGSPASATSSACQRPRARARGRARRQRLAPRGVGRHRTRAASSRARCRGCSTPSVGGGGDPRATPRAASGPSPSPSCPSASACRRCTPATGTRSWPRARRPAPSCACTSARRRARRPRRPTRRPTPSACCSSAGRCSPPSTGCTPRSRCASPTCKICLSEGGIGWVAGLLDRLDHVGRYQQMYGTWDGIDLTPARGAAAQLLVLRHRRPVRRSSSATASASTTSCSSPTTRTRTAPGPTPRRSCCAAQIGHFPADDIRKLTWENASQPVPTSRCPTRCRTIPMRTDADADRWTPTDIRFRIAAARRILYREGCDSQRRRARQRPRHRRGRRVLGHRASSTSTRPRPTGVCKLGFDLAAARRRAGVLARGELPRPHLRDRGPTSTRSCTCTRTTCRCSRRPARTVGMYNVASVLFHDEQATYFDDGVKSHLDVVDALGDKRVVLMKNHGAIVASRLARARHHRGGHARAVRPLPPRVRGRRRHRDPRGRGASPGKAMYRKHFLPNMWDANLARLRTLRSRPVRRNRLMTERLDGRVAIVTGAARGQGAAEAELFVAEGARGRARRRRCRRGRGARDRARRRRDVRGPRRPRRGRVGRASSRSAKRRSARRRSS